MGIRRVHTTSSHGVKKHFHEMPESLKLVSMAEYVTDMGFYDSQNEVSDDFWPSASASEDVNKAMQKIKTSKKKPH